MNIEEADMLESIRTCGEHIFHFHVADSNRMYPGAGHLDFKAILSALEGTGYKGWISRGSSYPNRMRKPLQNAVMIILNKS